MMPLVDTVSTSGLLVSRWPDPRTTDNSCKRELAVAILILNNQSLPRRLYTNPLAHLNSSFVLCLHPNERALNGHNCTMNTSTMAGYLNHLCITHIEMCIKERNKWCSPGEAFNKEARGAWTSTQQSPDKLSWDYGHCSHLRSCFKMHLIYRSCHSIIVYKLLTLSYVV